MNREITPFESIRRTNPAGNEFWSSRDFAKVLGYADYRNFQSVIESARTACFNSGQRVDDHFVEVTEMVEIGSAPLRTSCSPAAPATSSPRMAIQGRNPSPSPRATRKSEMHQIGGNRRFFAVESSSDW
jgi:hypothetical protein